MSEASRHLSSLWHAMGSFGLSSINKCYLFNYFQYTMVPIQNHLQQNCLWRSSDSKQITMWFFKSLMKSKVEQTINYFKSNDVKAHSHLDLNKLHENIWCFLKTLNVGVADLEQCV